MAGLRRTNQYIATREASTDGEEVASFLDALRRRDWTDAAACAGSEDFFPDEGGASRGNIASASQLIPILVCERCPVRRRCLEAGCETWEFGHSASREHVIEAKTLRTPAGHYEYTVIEAPVQSWTYGVWGGSTMHERWALRDLPASEAVEILEGTFDQRLGDRIEAWRGWVAARQAGGGGHGRYDKRLGAILAARESSVGRFHVGGQGGPGRGHKGAVGILATELKCSRDTAWRRLKAAA